MLHRVIQKKTSRPTQTIEDYLMTMYVMKRDYNEIVAVRIAEMMNVTPATVAITLKRMERDNWITGKERKDIRLTETGRAAAESVIRRHMLTEWMLVNIFKIPLFKTHEEAHNIEHAISPILEERMREILRDPEVCPHGNPFPGHEDLTKNWIPLTEIPAGESVIIRRIHEFVENNHDLLNYLDKNGLVPGTRAQLVEILPFNQTLTMKIVNRKVALGFSAARYIFAELSAKA